MSTCVGLVNRLLRQSHIWKLLNSKKLLTPATPSYTFLLNLLVNKRIVNKSHFPMIKFILAFIGIKTYKVKILPKIPITTNKLQCHR